MTLNGSSDLFRSEVVICWNDPASSKLHICTNLKNGRTYLRTKISKLKETWQILSFNSLPVNIFIINLQQIRAEHLMFKICSSNITFLTYFFLLPVKSFYKWCFWGPRWSGPTSCRPGRGSARPPRRLPFECERPLPHSKAKGPEKLKIQRLCL